jgi:hypothetical protein
MNLQTSNLLRIWKDYNNSSVKRGSLTFWIEENTIAVWLYEAACQKRDRPYLYSSCAIQTALMLKVLCFTYPCELPKACYNLCSSF